MYVEEVGWPGDSGSLRRRADRKSTRLNSSHSQISYAVFCLKKKKMFHIYCTNASTADSAATDSVAGGFILGDSFLGEFMLGLFIVADFMLLERWLDSTSGC